MPEFVKWVDGIIWAACIKIIIVFASSLSAEAFLFSHIFLSAMIKGLLVLEWIIIIIIAVLS